LGCRPFLTLVATAAIFTGCAAPVDIDQSVTPSMMTAHPEIRGPHGQLTARQSETLFGDVGGDTEDLLRRHLVVEQAIAGAPLITGNHTTILRDGPETFHAMFAAVKGAKHHVDLEYFIFEDISSDGQSLGDLLIAKQNAGVAVRVLYDSFGSSDTPSEFLDRLQGAGIAALRFNSFNPFNHPAKGYAPNDRDHRKILIADDDLAIVGGVNMSATYQGSMPGKSAPAPTQQGLKVRDTDLQINGPAVVALQEAFDRHWGEQGGPALAPSPHTQNIAAKGGDVIRVIQSSPDEKISRYYVTLLSALHNAEKRIWISAAYFVPTHQEREDLLDAARRGVDVRLLLPDASDSDLSILVQHSHYQDLLEAGAQIFESHDEVLHSKLVVVDGVWTIIGSSNFDQRSIVSNDEIDVVVIGRENAKAFEAMFQDDFKAAHQIDRIAWSKRPFSDRMRGYWARIWQFFL
jgi:cardiolipin synthase